MTELRESYDTLERFRIMKKGAVEGMDERGTDDIAGFVEVFRDDKPLLAILSPQIDRDITLNSAWFAAHALEADRVVVCLDAHMSSQMENPQTGKQWGPGEMQKACDEDGACSTGVITDCLVVNDVTKDGSVEMHTMPYHVNKEDKEVHWIADKYFASDSEGENEVSGLVPDTLQEAFHQSGLLPDDVPEEIISELGPVEVRVALDAAAITRLGMEGYAVMLMGEVDDAWFNGVNDLIQVFSRTMAKEPQDG